MRYSQSYYPYWKEHVRLLQAVVRYWSALNSSFFVSYTVYGHLFYTETITNFYPTTEGQLHEYIFPIMSY